MIASPPNTLTTPGKHLTLTIHRKYFLPITCALCLLVAVVTWETQHQATPPVATAAPAAAGAALVPSAPAAAPEQPQKSQLILELFNPSDQSVQRQLGETAISEQIEQALTVSFVLSKCGLLSQDAYGDAFQALVLYAEKTHFAPNMAEADARVRQIAQSASASYALIYSRTACTDPQLPVLATTLNGWVQTLH